MKYSKIYPSFREAFAVWQAFRKLGFPSDNIYMRRQMTLFPPSCESWGLFVELRWKGEEFTVCAAELEAAEKFEDEWKQFADKIATGNHMGLIKDIWERSAIVQNLPKLILALKIKGINPPLDSD